MGKLEKLLTEALNALDGKCYQAARDNIEAALLRARKPLPVLTEDEWDGS